MILWLIFAALTAGTAAVLLRPLLRRPAPLPARIDYDLAVYRDQLAETEKDFTRGLLDKEQARAARAEIHRRVLAAENAEAPAADIENGRRHFGQLVIILTVAVLLPAGALLVYVDLGAPELPGQPYAARAKSDPNFALAVEAEHAALAARDHPDVENFNRLGDILFRLGRYDDAAEAYQKATGLAAVPIAGRH